MISGYECTYGSLPIESVESAFGLNFMYVVNKFSNHFDITVFLRDPRFESFFGV